MTARLLIALAVMTYSGTLAHAQVRRFRNDYEGFRNAAGPLSEIDFETLPDGSPSRPGVDITSQFNYDAQGAHFSSPRPRLEIAGNPETDFHLDAYAPYYHTWIVADPTVTTFAVGAFFPGDTNMCAYDDALVLLGCASYGQSGSGFFVGLIASTPIARVTFDSNTNLEGISSYVFAPIPEPSAASALVLVWMYSRLRRPRRDLR